MSYMTNERLYVTIHSFSFKLTVLDKKKKKKKKEKTDSEKTELCFIITNFN